MSAGPAAPPVATLAPDWPVGPRIGALITLRPGGLSSGAFGLAGGLAGGLNLGEHCGDDPEMGRANRALGRGLLPAEPCWLNQVHGVAVGDCSATPPPGDAAPTADAAVTAAPGVVLAVLTADCLPVLLADPVAGVVGIAHAGWRGLAAGVIEQTIAAMVLRKANVARIAAYLGPAIGPRAFEVGDDVVAASGAAAQDGDNAWRACFRERATAGKWLADLYGLARLRLARAGVTAVTGGGRCTYEEDEYFYSYRRDGTTGRMGSFVWIEPAR